MAQTQSRRPAYFAARRSDTCTGCGAATAIDQTIAYADRKVVGCPACDPACRPKDAASPEQAVAEAIHVGGGELVQETVQETAAPAARTHVQLLTIRQDGRRLYVEGYHGQREFRGPLKDLGCTTEKNDDTGQWHTWIGVQKRAQLVALIARLSDPATAVVDAEKRKAEMLEHDREHVMGSCKADGRFARIVGHGFSPGRGEWYRLMDHAGTRTWFADPAKVALTEIRYYTDRDGQAKTRTLSGLLEYAQRAKQGGGGKLEAGYYYGKSGAVLAKGCSECTRLGRMCASCQHDAD